VVAHLFPDTVLSVAYGVRTDNDGLTPAAPPPTDTAADSGDAALKGDRADASPPVPEHVIANQAVPLGDAAIANTGVAAVVLTPPLPTESPPGARELRKPSPPVPPASATTLEATPPQSPPPPTALPIAAAAAPVTQAPVQSAGPSPGQAVGATAEAPPRVAPRQKPQAPATAARAPQMVALGSFAATDQSELASWGLLDVPSGYVDGAILARTGATLDPKATLQADDQIDIFGWVGDAAFGLPFRDVILSMCGKAVGRARVGEARPDVARAVHPNLGRAGWRTRVSVAHLPRCPDAVLKAWGVVPGAPTLVPLNGGPVLALPSPGAPPPPGAPPLQPKDIAAPKLGPIAIIAANAELRHCGSTDCRVAHYAPAGTYQGYVADEAGDWGLVVFGERVGWLPRAQYKAGP
jgi:hypothetical protein